MNFLKKIGLEPFIIMLFGSILLAYIYPPIGIDREGGVSLGEIANWGVSFIFFFYGICKHTIPRHSLSSIRNPRYTR